MAYTYQNYLEDEKALAEANKQAALNAAQTLYDQSAKQAEIQRNEAMTAANKAFERSKATYGLNAEYLAQAGLDNSGYSDNVTRDAYAARQTGYNAAGSVYADLIDAAERTRAGANLQAETEYNQYMAGANKAAMQMKKETDYAFNEIIGQIDYDTTKGEIDRLIDYYGFTKEQAAELYKTAGMELTDSIWNSLNGGNNAGSNNAGSNNAGGGNAGGGNAGGDNAGGDNVESEPKQTIPWPKTTTAIETLGQSLSAIDTEGGPSKSDIASLINTIVGYGNEGDELAQSSLEALFETHLNKINSNFGSEDTRTVGQYLYEKGVLASENGKYVVKSGLLNNNSVGGGLSYVSLNRGLSLRKGDNFKVDVVNSDGKTKTYTVQLGKKVENKNFENASDILNAGANVPDKGFFYYGGTLYIKKDGEIWSIEKTDNFRQVSYAEMSKAVTEGLDLSGVTWKVTHTNGTGNGDNITFTDSLGNEYKVQIDKKTSNRGAIALAEKYDAQVPFKYGSEVFIKMGDGNVYKIEPRSLGTPKQNDMYKNLLDALGRYQSEEQRSYETATKEEHIASSGVKILDVKSESALGNNKNIFVGNEEYSVQTGEEASSDVVDAARAAGAKAGDIFLMNGELYRVSETAIGTGYPSVYKLEARKMFKRGDYDELIKALGGVIG